jgi:hypothetical protein
MGMARDVEISLRVPNMKVRALDKTGQSIDHASMRFKKMVTLPAMPKLGETLRLTTSTGKTFSANVVRADWHEQRELFVLSCQFGNRGITPEEYGDLVNDPDWALKPLVE